MEDLILIDILKGIVAKRKNDILPGLFFGDMGICLSLYLINMKLKEKEIEQIADNLLDRTIQHITSMKDVSFKKGLSGIGWAINVLHMNKCIEGDIDNILYDVDALIYKSLTNQETAHDAEFSNGLIGILMYVVFRLKNKSHKKVGLQNKIIEATLRIIIDNLEMKIPFRFQMLSKDILTSVLWDYPILFYCLGEAMKLGIYKEKICSMVINWSFSFTTQFPYLSINRLAIANSISYLNEEIGSKSICSYIDTLFYSVNFSDYIHEIDKNNFLLSGDWFYAMLNVYAAQKLMNTSHCRYQELEITNKKLYNLYIEHANVKLINYEELQSQATLINGYSGIILAYFLLQEIFTKEHCYDYLGVDTY